MTWDDVTLMEDQRDVRDMVLEWRESLAPIASDDDVAAFDAAREGMIELGVWSIGMPEAAGGGEAGLDLRLIALAAVAGRSAALAWASAQAHAAVEVLGTAVDDDMVARIADGSQPVVVVGPASPACRVTVSDGRAAGTLERIDPAGEEPALILLDGDDAAWFVGPAALRAGETRARTGFAGARTCSVVVDGSAVRVDAVDVAGVSARLRLAAAAIAAGLALDAAGLAAAYASSRVQFGAPLTALPTVRLSLENQRHLSAQSLALTTVDDASSPARAEATLRGNLERAIEVTSAAIQSHGGNGYIEEYAVARLLRDAVSLRAASAVV